MNRHEAPRIQLAILNYNLVYAYHSFELLMIIYCFKIIVGKQISIIDTLKKFNY